MSSEIAIRASHLNYLSGAKDILNRINWEVRTGERWVVFGANGCGKTTLLSIIAGYKRFTSGELEVLGEAYTAENMLSLRRRIGWISSSFFDRCYHQERVLDIVLSSLSGTLGLPLTLTDAQICQAKALLKTLGIADKQNVPYDLLSKGEQQLVLIARAFLTRPEMLLLDEPGNGLDVLAREKLLAMIDWLAADRKMTMIYVTHYLEEILPVFEKCLLLCSGTIYRTGLTKELLTTERLSAFFEYPIQVNLKEGRSNRVNKRV